MCRSSLKAKTPLQKRVLLPLPGPPPQLCHVLRLLLRPRGWHLPVCLLLPLHLLTPATLPGQPGTQEPGLPAEGAAGPQCGECLFFLLCKLSYSCRCESTGLATPGSTQLLRSSPPLILFITFIFIFSSARLEASQGWLCGRQRQPVGVLGLRVISGTVLFTFQASCQRVKLIALIRGCSPLCRAGIGLYTAPAVLSRCLSNNCRRKTH